ncbi:MAG TPA: hypothetical protein VG273_14770 [Bryobacteraceae bacterium]|jgi:hypothetical protein|nr:hypothetical protein [Bryobacteraceae bacterium]
MRAPAILLLSILLLSGCAVRQPSSPAWRLTNSVLIPPGVAGPGVEKRKFIAPIEAGHGVCPPSIRVRGDHIQIAVSREMLLKQPDGWLTSWSEEMESRKCIAPGESAALADQVISSLPLDPDQAFRLLHASSRQSGRVDLASESRLQVVSPIMAPGTVFEDPVQTTGDGNALTLTVRAPAGMLGYETATYEIRPRNPAPGFRIVALSAEKHIDGATERTPQPATNYFRFSENAAFFRLFYKAGPTGFTALVAAAHTRAELNNTLNSCDDLPAGMCIAIPKTVAVNSQVAITVNGKELLVNWDTTVGEAIRAAGVRQPNTVLPHLAVEKLYDGHPAAVNFERSSPAILDLFLRGGESISWEQ